jgi:hypothetical protein
MNDEEKRSARPVALALRQGPSPGPHVGRHGRASSSAGRVPPLSAHERAMPPQQRARGDQAPAARGAWQLARRREQGTVRGAKLRVRDLATEDLELVAQDEQLDVLDVRATRLRTSAPRRGPAREVEKREGHGRRSPRPRADKARQDYWRPSGLSARCSILPQTPTTPTSSNAVAARMLKRRSRADSKIELDRLLAGRGAARS